MRIICILVVGFLLAISCTGTSHADYLTIGWWQDRESDIAGWKVYYAVHADGNVPDPPLGGTGTDVVDLEAFTEYGNPQQLPLPQDLLPDGLTVKPYPGWENDYWDISYRFYLPPLPPEARQRYYLAVTTYDLCGLESDFSEVLDFTMAPPGQPGKPVLD
ncbi:MAG: hypothetical protein V1736_03600 [Pseudomonadota bacterium]